MDFKKNWIASMTWRLFGHQLLNHKMSKMFYSFPFFVWSPVAIHSIQTASTITSFTSSNVISTGTYITFRITYLTFLCTKQCIEAKNEERLCEVLKLQVVLVYIGSSDNKFFSTFLLVDSNIFVKHFRRALS